MKTRPLSESLAIVPNDDLNLIIFDSLNVEEMQVVVSSLILRRYRSGIEDAAREDDFNEISSNVSPSSYLLEREYPVIRFEFKLVFDVIVAGSELDAAKLGCTNLAIEVVDFSQLFKRTIYSRSSSGKNEIEYWLCHTLLDVAKKFKLGSHGRDVLDQVFRPIFERNPTLRDQLGIISYSDVDDFIRGLSSKFKSFSLAHQKLRSKKKFRHTLPAYLKTLLKNLKVKDR